MLSSGGKHAGKSWSHPPRFAAQCLDNDHMRMAFLLRLGMVQVPEGSVCHVPRAGSSGELCLTQLSSPLEHPHLCKCGPARLRPHRSLQVRYRELLAKAGCFADLERAVPCLYRIDSDNVVTEAILDVVVSLPGGLGSDYIDVTVRCPHSVRNAQGARVAALQPSVAAADGELEKLTRYGSAVTPLSFETYGRLGVGSQQSLLTMAHRVASMSIHLGRRRGSDMYAEWRLELERVLVREIADITLLSLGHASGLHCFRARRRGRMLVG